MALLPYGVAPMPPHPQTAVALRHALFVSEASPNESISPLGNPPPFPGEDQGGGCQCSVGSFGDRAMLLMTWHSETSVSANEKIAPERNHAIISSSHASKSSPSSSSSSSSSAAASDPSSPASLASSPNCRVESRSSFASFASVRKTSSSSDFRSPDAMTRTLGSSPAVAAAGATAFDSSLSSASVFLRARPAPPPYASSKCSPMWYGTLKRSRIGIFFRQSSSALTSIDIQSSAPPRRSPPPAAERRVASASSSSSSPPATAWCESP
mmetsp:Transcript_17739/g.38404  ORF Transcript_17739/g.38404 Transcript_17739/m.38404 type:complete len:268 (+) Transcript_17739:116-919(+)